MKTRFISQYRAVTVSVINVLVTVLVLLIVIGWQGVSERTIAASLLILSFIVFCVSGILFTGRVMLNWQIEDIASYLVWERGFIIVATLATVLGLTLLEDLLHSAGDSFWARLGMMAYMFGAVLVVVAESNYISKQEWNDGQVVIYILLAFLAETAFGLALLQTGLVVGWVGWLTILWNLGILIIMLIVRPRDIYYPVIHYVAPFVIGIVLMAHG